LTISPISTNPTNSTNNVQWQSTARAHRPDMKKDMQSVADLFGISTDDLMSQLKGGKSLAEIAQSKGVSRTDLVATLEQSIKANAPTDVQTDFSSRIDDMVNRIVDRKGMPGPPPARPQSDDVSGVDFKAKVEQMLSTIASQLKISPDDLVSQLQHGSSLREIAVNAGSDPTQVLDAIGRGLAVNVLA
jgi:hypothetical protein